MRMEMVDSSIAMPMEMAKAMAMVDCNESTVYDDVLRGIRMCIEHDDIVLQLNEFVSVDENENSFHDALQWIGPTATAGIQLTASPIQIEYQRQHRCRFI